MKTGIVILNYNNYIDTINCIKSVLKYCIEENPLIIVVDNGSKNDSIKQIQFFFNENEHQYNQIINDQEDNQLASNIVIISTMANLGYAKGNNVGIRFLLKQRVDNILILNNDIVLTEKILPSLTKILYADKSIGLLSPLLIKNDNTIDYNCCRKNPSMFEILCEAIPLIKLPYLIKVIDKKYILKKNTNSIKQELIFCDIISGACIIAKSSTWDLLNYFDENTFLYYEENILFEKLKKLNLRSALITSVKATHIGAESTKHVSNTNILRIELNSLLYYIKTYRKDNKYMFYLIKVLKLIRIYLVEINNCILRLTNKSQLK